MKAKPKILLPIVCICWFSIFSGAVAQRESRPTAPAKARAVFKKMKLAAEELRAIEVTPADENGQIRVWDRKWKTKLERLDAQTRYDLFDNACLQCETRALLHDLRITIELARNSIYDRIGGDGDWMWDCDPDMPYCSYPNFEVREAVASSRIKIGEIGLRA